MKRLSYEQTRHVGAGSFSDSYTFQTLTLMSTTTAGAALGVTSLLPLALWLNPNNPLAPLMLTIGFLTGGTLGFSFGVDVIEGNISLSKSA